MKATLDKMIDKATGFDKHKAFEQIKEMLKDENCCITLDLRSDEDNEHINDPDSGLMDFICCGMMELKGKPDKLACIVHVSKIDFNKWRNQIEVKGLPYITELDMYFYPEFDDMQKKSWHETKAILVYKSR